MTYCKQCLEKQRKIDELQEEIVRLKAKLRYQERTAEEGFFGSSTPSSKVPIKANRHGEEPRPHGGGKVGHRGHGRRRINAEQADRVERITVGDVCPDCGSPLEAHGSKSRTVIDCQPVRIQKVMYRLERKRCPHCRRLFTARAPGVLAKWSSRRGIALSRRHALYSLFLLSFDSGVSHYSAM
jgi:transposase